MTRRDFALGSGAGLGAVLGAWKARADDEGSYAIRRRKKVEILFQSPEGHPGGLEATQDGLWVREQVTDRAHLLHWETGRPLASFSVNPMRV